MKKRSRTILFVLLVASLLSGCAKEPAPQMAETLETQDRTAGPAAVTGTVEAAQAYPITAPLSGTLLPFDSRCGDTVTKNDVVFVIDTLKVYAPYGGAVRGVQATQGDSAEAVQARYGALCYIEPEHMMMVDASTDAGYDRKENKEIHIGESLYVKSRDHSRITGSGVVIAVNGTEYTVALETNAFEMEESVTLYRESDYQSDSKVGKGKVTRSGAIPVNAGGYLLAVHVSEGQPVEKGGLLFEVSDGDIDSAIKSNVMHAPQSGILGDIAVSAGQRVQRGQLLATVYDPSDMYVLASVDEMDLDGLSRGEPVRIQFDSFPGKSYEGRVEAISGLGKQRQNASYYDIRVSFPPNADVKLGMSATVYLPE